MHMGWRAAREDRTMLREPCSVEFFHAPPEFLCARAERVQVRLPLGGQVDPLLLHRFASRMAVRGHAVQLARMGYDRLYAIDCLALAHASADEALRADALRLFCAFEHKALP